MGILNLSSMEIRTLLAGLLLATVSLAVPMQEDVTDLQASYSNELDSAVSLLQTTISKSDTALTGHRAAIKLLATKMAVVQAKAASAGSLRAQAVKVANFKADKLTQMHSVCNVKLKLVKQKAQKARLVIEEVEAKAGKLNPKSAGNWRREWVSPVARAARTAARIAKQNLAKLNKIKTRALQQMQRRKKAAAKLALKARRSTKKGLRKMKKALKQNIKNQRRAEKKLKKEGRKAKRNGERASQRADVAVSRLKNKAEKTIFKAKVQAAKDILEDKKIASRSIMKEAKSLMKDMAARMTEAAAAGGKKGAGILSSAKLKKPRHTKVIKADKETKKGKHAKPKRKVGKALRKHMKAEGHARIKEIVKNKGKGKQKKSSAKMEAALDKSLKKNKKMLKSIANGTAPKEITTH